MWQCVQLLGYSIRNGEGQGYVHVQLECAASNGNRYPPYPQVMATAISQ